jgi:hypothetical protein
LLGNREKGNAMSYRTIISFATAAVIGISCISTEALAWRGRAGVYHGGVYRGGVYRGGVYRGGVYRGAYVRRGVGVGVGAAAVGAAAVGAAVAAPYYYGRPACGYAPYPPCY